MTKAQQGLYLATWIKVKNALVRLGGYSNKDAEAQRHKIHIEALGQDKSSKDFTNAEFDRVLDAMQVYLGLSDPRQSKRAVEEPRKRALYAIRALSFPPEYIATIARSKFNGCDDWTQLGESDLWKLKLTLTERARAKQRQNAAAVAAETVNPF